MAGYIYTVKNISNPDKPLRVGSLDLDYMRLGIGICQGLMSQIQGTLGMNQSNYVQMYNYGGTQDVYRWIISVCNVSFDEACEYWQVSEADKARQKHNYDIMKQIEGVFMGLKSASTSGDNVLYKYEQLLNTTLNETLDHSSGINYNNSSTNPSYNYNWQPGTIPVTAYSDYAGTYTDARATLLAKGCGAWCYIGKYDDPTEAFTNAKKYAGECYSLNIYDVKPGSFPVRYLTLQRTAPNSYSPFYNFTNINELSPVEVFEDSENTYPGGGEDQNTYPEDGESGKGDFDNTNDPIDFPTIPTWDVQSTGFISLWNPTIVQLTNLYTFLWDSDISTTLKKLFNEPMNAIFSLGIVPVDPVTQGTRRLTIGHVDTEIDMESIQKQFVTFDFGSIDINEYYGAAWDYSPYTQASIYLPYIGIQSVDVDDIMNCTLTLRYNIDILTGTTIALLKCVRKGRDNLNAVMYEWQGNCVTQCPITAGNWSQIMASVIQLGAMTGLALSQPVVGGIGSAVGSSAAAEYAQGKNLVNPTMATYGALNVLGSKVHVQRGGRIDMSAGAMSMQKAYVIINRPISGIPRGWNKYAGYPSLKIKTLGSQEGFVSIGAIKLDGLRATADEITELDTILKAGIII